MATTWLNGRSRKELAVFPVLSGAAGFVVAIIFFTPALFTVDYSEDGGATPGAYVLLAGVLRGQRVVMTFFGAALISRADIALEGGNPRASRVGSAPRARWPAASSRGPC